MRLIRQGCCLLFLAVAASSCDHGHGVQPVEFDAEDLESELRALDEALEGVRIVLLGENGHGVREHTEVRVRLTEWLHREHGFDLVLFESGFFECGQAAEHIQELAAQDALRGCLRYPLEYAELLPLFELFRGSPGSEGLLRFGGVDFQAQGFDSEPRPEASFRWLAGVDSELASRIARSDSALFLVPQTGGLGDAVYRYAFENAEQLNDHARYGRFPAASGDSIRSTGSFLRERYGPELLSVGLFFGRSHIADNARRTRAVAPLPSGSVESFLAVGRQSYLVLRDNRNPEMREWASAPRPYLRMGLDTMFLEPGQEFDALIYIDSVNVPTYDLRGGG